MDLLTRLFGEEAARRIRDGAREARAPRRASQTPQPSRPMVPAPPEPALPVPPRPMVPVTSRARRAMAPLDEVPVLATFTSDFPTSILGTARMADAPLLAAFGSRDALLAAIVFSEALAPPVGLREQNPLRF